MEEEPFQLEKAPAVICMGNKPSVEESRCTISHQMSSSGRQEQGSQDYVAINLVLHQSLFFHLSHYLFQGFRPTFLFSNRTCHHGEATTMQPAPAATSLEASALPDPQGTRGEMHFTYYCS